jgi:hypothetical protein
MDYISRTQWGATKPKRKFVPLNPSRVKGVVVHHGGVADPPSGRAAVIAYERHHIQTRGWLGIAYNWLVDENGVVYEGRGWFRGGATKGWNSRSVSVCYTGYGEFEPSDQAKKSIQRVIAECMARYGDHLWVKTHRQFKKTTCPGLWLGDWVENGLEVPHNPSNINWDAIANYVRDLKTQVTRKPLSRRRRSRGEVVRVVQRALANRGHDPGPVDGVYGRKTAQAVKDFQRAQGFLKADGVVGVSTFTALFIQ